MEASEVNIVLNTLADKDNNGLLHVSLVPRKEGQRKPAAVICMLDVSGSMDSAGSIEQTESGGYSILDLVKHSMKTILSILSPEDHLCLIEFESTARVIFPLQKLTADAKLEAENAIENMRADGGTRIWKALKQGLKVAQENAVCQEVNTSLWLFTDGESEAPACGIVGALQKALGGKELTFTINTFGFGYQMDSKMLSGVSEVGNGIFGYIPDCNIIGTTFVNCLANVLSASVKQSLLVVKSEGIESKAVKSVGYEMSYNTIDAGTIQYGQARDFLFRFPLPPDKSQPFKFEVSLYFEGKTVSTRIEGLQAKDPAAVYRTLARTTYCEILDRVLKQLPTYPSSLSFLTELQNFLMALPCKDEADMKAMLRDLTSEDEMEGRVTKAFSTAERIDRWGQHYVRSIIRAHQMELCHNFKDPGVQVYGGKLFKELQMQAEKIFCTLPPPKQSRPQDLQVAQEASVASAAPAPPPAVAVNMQSYMDCGGGGCFDGKGEVRLVDGTVKKVKELKKNDRVLDSTGQSSRVVCLVAFPINRTIPVAKSHGLFISPKHPVRAFGQWYQAQDLASVEPAHCDCIYNLVLEKNHVVSVNNVDLITLGHGMTGPVVEHPYYGSQQVINDLKRVPGWTHGAVIMTHCHKAKDATTGLVTALTTLAA